MVGKVNNSLPEIDAQSPSDAISKNNKTVVRFAVYFEIEIPERPFAEIR